ncbi:hypothetical protein PP175_29540 (plasmid) [Aneurinibacillus sp. Ricciae_BoGa-3]|uniref:hypothetical protein n=1 Tax=Aneurinibacillus sp. Ricciae_BoGa-3 TaxID=3022697 RepID=UPI00233FB9BB|nr:hypothetical protein [Aneurinibacillus sp. Ricciae_BoGa-3]WCK57336.1 hypothetical protein PP175_29540 [Aneurinibacillus sp. Ricciae_BoGa-3]
MKSMMFPPEYEEFASLIKYHVVYTLVLRVLPGDRETIAKTPSRLGKAYVEVLNQIELDIEKELRNIRMRLRELNGKIVEEKQEESARIVQSSLKGIMYKHRFNNIMLHHDCEDTIKAFIQGTKPVLS